MESILLNPSVTRAKSALISANMKAEIRILESSARTAQEAADALGILVGQIASSIVFRLPDNSPLLVITSGRHKVDVDLVAEGLRVEKLHRADADFVRLHSGFAIGGVSPLGWLQPATVLIDLALDDYDVVWAAAGHPHAVFPTTFGELITATKARRMVVGD
ncbi:MAG: YbaK/EbsC family protein [Candidatus Nanopelagicaceae bacterium]|nr:YbaK/EbsC family protein [Candidatus Nanopelagicaceae bacterium]